MGPLSIPPFPLGLIVQVGPTAISAQLRHFPW